MLTRKTDFSRMFENESKEDSNSMFGDFLKSIDSTQRAEFEKIKSVPGVSQASLLVSPDKKIYTVQFRFTGVAVLNACFPVDDNQMEFFTYEKKKLSFKGGIPGIVSSTAEKTDEDETTKAVLKEARYNLIIHFPGKIKSCSNSSMRKTKKDLQYHVDVVNVIGNPGTTKFEVNHK